MNMSMHPRHIAIIMDGNGRWAQKKSLPRAAGHKAGLKAARQAVEFAIEKKIEVLTLFIFSSENWRRPKEEVNYLMHLFIMMLQRDAKKLHKKNVQLRVIGNRGKFESKLQKYIEKVETLTAFNKGLKLVLAANYGGQWDLTEAMRKIAFQLKNNKISVDDINQEMIGENICCSDLPEPDLFIRSGGEIRISNFFLWQLAYTELYFTPVLWPDFDKLEFEKALAFFSQRERRFGYISEQLK